MSRHVIAVVGSRDFKPLSLVVKFVASLPGGVTIISGGARGVDQAAVRQARLNHIPAQVFIADWKRHRKAAGPIRNSELVRLADEVVAFWDGKSKGTADTIRKAKAAGKPVWIVHPDRKLESIPGGNPLLRGKDHVELLREKDFRPWMEG